MVKNFLNRIIIGLHTVCTITLFLSSCTTRKDGILLQEYGTLSDAYVDSSYNFSIGLKFIQNRKNISIAPRQHAIRKVGLKKSFIGKGREPDIRYLINSGYSYRLCTVYPAEDYGGFIDAFYTKHKDNARISNVSEVEYTKFPPSVKAHNPRVFSYHYSRKRDTLQGMEVFLHLKYKSKVLRLTYLNKNPYEKTFIPKDTWGYYDFEEINTFRDSIHERSEKELKRSPDLFGLQIFRESNYNYLAPVNLLEKYAAKMDTILHLKQRYPYTQSLFYSFSGNVARSREVYPVEGFNSEKQFIDTTQNIIALPLLTKIGEISRKEQVIMLNEHHLNPYCRVFASSLLDTLYQNGYRHLFVEGFYRDSLFQYRKYPIQHNGMYLADPMFGNFIRHALALGFKVLPYEYNGEGDREKGQAENIIDYFSIEGGLKNQKILVYAGHGHIYKKNKPYKLMAQHFREISGITPFCIEQAATNGNGLRAADYAYLRKHHIEIKNNPITLINQATGAYYTPKSLSGLVDAVVIHPPTEYVDDKFPDWLLRQGKYEVPIKLNGEKYRNALISISRKSEGDTLERGQLIPILNLVLGKKNRFSMYLNADRYYMTVYDENKKRLLVKEVNVKP